LGEVDTWQPAVALPSQAECAFHRGIIAIGDQVLVLATASNSVRANVVGWGVDHKAWRARALAVAVRSPEPPLTAAAGVVGLFDGAARVHDVGVGETELMSLGRGERTVDASPCFAWWRRIDGPPAGAMGVC